MSSSNSNHFENQFNDRRKNLLAQTLSKKIIMKYGMNRFPQGIFFYEGITKIKLFIFVIIEDAKYVFINTNKYCLIPINLVESSRKKYPKLTEILIFKN